MGMVGLVAIIINYDYFTLNYYLKNLLDTLDVVLFNDFFVFDVPNTLQFAISNLFQSKYIRIDKMQIMEQKMYAVKVILKKKQKKSLPVIRGFSEI